MRMAPSDETAVSDMDTIMEMAHDQDYAEQRAMRDPIAYVASCNNKKEKDTMYYHEAMCQDDRNKFVEAIAKEFNAHIENKHWSLIDKSEVPQETTVIPSVWSMKRKRDISTRKITKYKARLNLHGGKQE